MTTSYGKNYFRFRSGQRFLSTKTCRWSLATDWKSCVLLSSAGPVETLWNCALWLFNVEYGWAPCTTNFSWPRVYQWCNWRSSFFKYGVLPEWNTKTPFYCNTQTSSDFHGNTEPDDPCQNSSTSIDKWCYCGGPEEGQMICCDNKCVVSHRLFKDSYYSN